jgi:hypothetical protein
MDLIIWQSKLLRAKGQAQSPGPGSYGARSQHIFHISFAIFHSRIQLVDSSTECNRQSTDTEPTNDLVSRRIQNRERSDRVALTPDTVMIQNQCNIGRTLTAFSKFVISIG